MGEELGPDSGLGRLNSPDTTEQTEPTEQTGDPAMAEGDGSTPQPAQAAEAESADSSDSAVKPDAESIDAGSIAPETVTPAAAVESGEAVEEPWWTTSVQSHLVANTEELTLPVKPASRAQPIAAATPVASPATPEVPATSSAKPAAAAPSAAVPAAAVPAAIAEPATDTAAVELEVPGPVGSVSAADHLALSAKGPEGLTPADASPMPPSGDQWRPSFDELTLGVIPGDASAPATSTESDPTTALFAAFASDPAPRGEAATLPAPIAAPAHAAMQRPAAPAPSAAATAEPQNFPRRAPAFTPPPMVAGVNPPRATSTPKKVLIGIGAGVLVVGLLAGLFFVGTTIGGGASAAPVPTPTPTPTSTPEPEPVQEPTGPQAAGVHSWDTLYGGECLQPYTTPWSEEFTVVDCATPHAAQLAYRGVVDADPAAAYPGDAALAAQMNLLCSAAGVIDLAAAGEYSDVQVQGTYPATAEEWDEGVRNYQCFVSRSSGELFNSSIAGPGPAI